MNQVFWTDERVAGSLLAVPLPIIVLALIILIASGALPATSAYMGGEFAQAAPYAATFRLLFLLSALGWLVQTLGLGLFSRLLVRAGQDQLAVLAFTLVLFAAPLAVLWATFRMSVELWAVQEAAHTGSLPALFAPLLAWTNDFFRLASVSYLVAGGIAGIGILRIGIISSAIGWATITWTVLWLVARFTVGAGVPAIPVIMPAVIGIALLWRA
jgi:hypothetical protein